MLHYEWFWMRSRQIFSSRQIKAVGTASMDGDDVNNSWIAIRF